jgi:penicillin-binding protein 1C
LADPSAILAYKTDNLTFFGRHGKVIYQTSGRYIEETVPLGDISPYVVKATLAAEDKHFYEHSGVHLPSTARAFYNSFKKGDIYHQGGSTITQQLARTVFLTNDKSVSRKLKETILALEIEKRYSKKEILELYFNSTYYGVGAYGVDQAARVYFSKSPKKLTLAESSFLAALTTAPSRLSPTNGDKEAAFRRQEYVLGQMVKAGFITKKQALKVKNVKIKFALKKLLPTQAPHFILFLKKALREEFPDVDVDTSGFKVYTTLDLRLQKKAEGLLAERVAALKYRNVNNAAFLATNPKTGEILTMAGSANFSQKKWGTVNVLTSRRSPGSAIKPLVYAAALELGAITPATILHDQKTTYQNAWETYTPGNSDGRFRGQMLPRRALSNSINVPAVEVAAKTGVPKLLKSLDEYGIDGLGPLSDYWLSVAIGGLELRGIDLAAAYAAMANGGYLIKPWGIIKVEDKFGEVVYELEQEKRQVLDPKVAYIITNILSDSYARKELFGWYNPLEIGRPAAVKTGTSQDFKNAWAVGYTPSLLSLAWFGNNDSSPMVNIWGLESAALVWNIFMRDALTGKKVEAFVPPKGVVFASVCSLDGSKAVAGQPASREVFFANRVPNSFGACAYLAQKKKEEKTKVVLAQVKETKKHYEQPKDEDKPNIGTPIQ